MTQTQTPPAPVESLPDSQALRQRLRDRLRVPVTTYRLQLHHAPLLREKITV